jgi:hypothetical protein
MGVYDDIKKTLRGLLLLEERLDDIATRLENHEAALDDHEKRVIRIETLIELARETEARRRLD